MHWISACFIGILGLMVYMAASADGNLNATGNTTENATLNATQNTPQNATQSSAEDAAIDASQGSKRHGKVLRAGFEKIKDVNNLDVLSSRPMHNLETAGQPRDAFDLSQRVGNVSNFTANTSIYKPFYSIDEYRRTKPNYEAPGNLADRKVYSISGYPLIKTANSIP
ncbi:Uncharacterised protein [uncultured archaeon]|nr:Uncharacterised protein [uncultured archaeon]